MDLLQHLRSYIPQNEQEKCDQLLMLQYLQNNPLCLLRSDKTAHFTASIWTVNRTRDKALMVYHNIYDSWSWIGGHADGEEDLANVALRELSEETGLQQAHLVSPEIFSLEILTVNGHEKSGQYVPCHLHYNVTYLTFADETAPLKANPAENKAVQWMTFEQVLQESTEPWMVQRIYKKLIHRCKQSTNEKSSL